MTDVNQPTPDTAVTSPSAGQRLDKFVTAGKNKWNSTPKQQRKIAFIGLVSLLCLIVLFYSISGSGTGKATKANYLKVELGMSEEKVKAILGPPSQLELSGGGTLWTWYPAQYSDNGVIRMRFGFGKALSKGMDGVD